MRADRAADRLLVGCRHAVDGDDQVTGQQSLCAGPPTVTEKMAGISVTGCPSARSAATTASSWAVSIMSASSFSTSSADLPGGVDRSRGQGVAMRQPVGQQRLRQAEPGVAGVTETIVMSSRPVVG